MYILDCLKVGSNVYSSIDHSPGGKPNTPSHPVTAGHVADGQRGSGYGGITCGIGYGYELAILPGAWYSGPASGPGLNGTSILCISGDHRTCLGVLHNPSSRSLAEVILSV